MGEENQRTERWETRSSRFRQRKDMKAGRLKQSRYARNTVKVAIEAENLLDAMLPRDGKVDGISCG